MSDLQAFHKQIESVLQQAERSVSGSVPSAQEMDALRKRHHRFGEISSRLLAEIIAPRVKEVASFFPNAVPERRMAGGHCTWWFGYCEQFPASTKLDFGFAHDERIESMYLQYELFVLPSFVRYDRFDHVAFPLEQIDDVKIAAWVEDKLVGFVKSYLQLEATDREQSESFATDPVCRMRIIRDRAAGHVDYRGHRFFFCTQSCLDEFTADPDHFALLKLNP